MQIRTKPLHPIEKRQFPDDHKNVDLGPFYNFALSVEIHNTIPIRAGINGYEGFKFVNELYRVHVL
jgi:hypothetical protein